MAEIATAAIIGAEGGVSEERNEAEKRWGVRVTIRNLVKIRWESAERLGTMRNISVSGCFIETPFPYPPGASVELGFILDPEKPHIQAEGKIVSRNHGGIGVRFLYRDAETPLELKRWIGARQQSPSAPH